MRRDNYIQAARGLFGLDEDSLALGCPGDYFHGAPDRGSVVCGIMPCDKCWKQKRREGESARTVRKPLKRAVTDASIDCSTNP